MVEGRGPRQRSTEVEKAGKFWGTAGSVWLECTEFSKAGDEMGAVPRALMQG